MIKNVAAEVAVTTLDIYAWDPFFFGYFIEINENFCQVFLE